LAQRKPVILAVDDEENPLALRKLILQRAGYEVVTATSVKQALQVLAAHPVDLVLSDQLMPGGTGTELARRVKSDYPGLPVVIVSGVNEMPVDAGHADLFISKLEGPAYLTQQISDILRSARAPN